MSDGRKGGDTLESRELAGKIVALAEEKQAEDILLLDLRPVTIIADYFLIFTVNSERQSETVVEWIRESLKKEHHRSPLNIEGESRSGWVLMDYGDVIVHVMSEDQRAYYRLEDLWKQAPVVLRVQ
jgi:ribosome-associated protein